MTQRLRIYFQGEVPRIGSGWRTVEVLSVGPVWAVIREPIRGRRHRFPRKLWDDISRTAKEVTDGDSR